MRALGLCTSCKRHVKRSETRCPFCSAAVAPERDQAATVVRGLPGGRAALFLTGAVLATGCTDEHEPDDSPGMVIPPYGVAIPADAGSPTRPDAGAQFDASLVAPPYGISIPAYGIAIDASIATPKDAGPSCPQVGNLPVPVYGIGIDVPAVDTCRDAGPDADTDAGKDAGAADAGKDAAAADAGDAGKDSGLIAVPPYGIAIPAYGIAIDPKI